MLTITVSARALAFATLAAVTFLAVAFVPGAFGSNGVPDAVYQGDINCDEVVNEFDALGALQYTAGLDVDQQDPCFGPGSIAAIPGPQGEPGISLYALVNSAGALQGGTAVSASSPSTGAYEVTFAQDIGECAATANPGSVGPGSITTSHTAIASLNKSGANTIVVAFANHESTPIATSFHLIVAC